MNQRTSESAPTVRGQHIEFLEMRRSVEQDRRRESHRLPPGAHDPETASRRDLLEKASRKPLFKN